MENRTDEISDILYGELKMRQPDERAGPRVNVDTVLLADFARVRAGARVVEMGCAHGAIALIAARRRKICEKKFPGRAAPRIDAFDINPDLVALARENAALNGLSDDVNFFKADLRDARARFAAGSYDAAIMNPPYDEPRTSRPSPDGAVAAAMHGTACTLDEVVCAAKYLLKNGGKFFLIMRAKRLGALFHILTERNVAPKRMRAVHPKPGRAASVVLVEAVRDGGEGLDVLPPFFIHGPDGAYTPELLAAYRLEEPPCP